MASEAPHELEIEIEEIYRNSRSKTLGGIIDAIKERPDALYLQIAACSLLGNEASYFNDYFKKNKDIPSIQKEVARFGGHARMAPLFIPDNLEAVIAYRNLSFVEEARNLVDFLIYTEEKNYLSQIFLMKDALFEGNISLAIKKFNPRVLEPEEVIVEHIKSQETFPAGSNNENDYLNFHFYKLNQFSYVEAEKVDSSLEKILVNLKNKLTLDLYLTGQVTNSGVFFQVNLTPSLSIFEELNPSPFKLKSLKEIIAGASGDMGSDQISQQLTDLLVNQPAAAVSPEATLVAAAITLAKNLVTFDSNSRKTRLEHYYKEVRDSKASFRDFYTEFVKSSFVTFLHQHSMELSDHDQLNPICENIYKNLLLWINSFIRDQDADFVDFKEKYPLRDEETIKLFFAYELIVKPEVENHHKNKRKKKIL